MTIWIAGSSLPDRTAASASVPTSPLHRARAPPSDRDIDSASPAASAMWRAVTSRSWSLRPRSVRVRAQLVPVLRKKAAQGRHGFWWSIARRGSSPTSCSKARTTCQVGFVFFDDASLARTAAVYASILVRGSMRWDDRAAEMTKLLGMLYRYVNIALATSWLVLRTCVVDCDRVRHRPRRRQAIAVRAAGLSGHCRPSTLF